MNYELPKAMAMQAGIGLRIYWDQLKNDRDWIHRLAEAKIYPFGIIGSGRYEKGAIDPDVIYWLDG